MSGVVVCGEVKFVSDWVTDSGFLLVVTVSLVKIKMIVPG
jgi:hypothetical protein